jgi:hypothetical protein
MAEGSLSFEPYGSVAAARHAIDVQRVYAALDLTSARPTLYVSSAAGASVARVLERISASDPVVRLVDTHPLSPSDPNGLDIFYLMLVATIVGFLTVFQVRANAGGLPLYHWTAWVAGFVLTAALALTLVVGPVLSRFHRAGGGNVGHPRTPHPGRHLFRVAHDGVDRTVGRPPDLALLRRARQQLVGWRRLAAAAAGALRLRLAMASVWRHGHLASRGDLLQRLPARAADAGARGLVGDALRRIAGRIAPPRDKPGLMASPTRERCHVEEIEAR